MTLTVTRHARPARMAEITGGVLDALRRHRLLAALVGLGTVLRALAMIAYPQPFWLQGDSQSYLATAYSFSPGTTRPSGYSVFLALFVPLQSTPAMAAAQHVLGLGIAIAGYVFLQRRGVSRLVSALAAIPVLLDGRTVVIEHYLLSETLFTALLVAGTLVLLWRDRPGVWHAAATGALFAGAATTRSVGLLTLALPMLYLVVRGVGWRPFGAFLLAAAIPLGGYLVWYHAAHGRFAFTDYSGRFLWARTTTFMDCAKLDLTPQERPICPPEPLDRRHTPEWYLWAGATVQKYTTLDGDAIHGALARKAILRQPGDYLTTVARDTWNIMTPYGVVATNPCNLYAWYFPADTPDRCAPYIAPRNPYPRRLAGKAYDKHSPLMTPLHAYSTVATVPGGMAALAFVLALVALVRRSGVRLRDRLDPLLLTTIGLGVIVGAVAAATTDTRYVAPALPFAAVGAALAWQQLRHRTPRAEAGRPAPDARPAGADAGGATAAASP